MRPGIGLLALAAHVLVICAAPVYDYVIIGGGTGGLVVASRLAEDPEVNVLVVEAGPNAEHLPEVYIPGRIGAGQAYTTLNWAYQTVPQTNFGGRKLVINAGRALGGSTTINSMIMTRATKAQYDAFGSLNNDTEAWTWDGMLPYFKRSEIFTPPNKDQTAHGARYDPSVHGFPSKYNTEPAKQEGGRVEIGFPNFFFPQSEMFVQAAIRSGSGLEGFERARDLSDGNVERRIGVASNSLDAASNTRCSSVCAYYTPFKGRPNFGVITNATVSRIIWDEDRENGLVAKAVEYYVDGVEEPRYANLNVAEGGEVVLAAGTIGTPKVMELSGVGNATLLQSLGVDPVLDLPSIGENLADHIHSWTSAFSNASITKDILSRDAAFLEEQLALWYHNQTGMLSAAPRTLGMAAASSLLPRDRVAELVNEARQNLEQYAVQFANGDSALQKGIEAQHRIALGLYERDEAIPVELNIEPGYIGPTPPEQRPARDYTTISAIFYNPLSRGRTHITSADRTVPPAVDPAYWSHPLDVAMHVAGFQVARKLLRAPPLDEIFQGEFEPGSMGESDEEVEAWLRRTVEGDNHETGTMAMMPRELGGVVDTELKVYGTRNVRVADASIIPLPISAHLASTVYAIGEMAADMIKNKTKWSMSKINPTILLV